MSEYSQRFEKPIGVSRRGMGGAATMAGIEALAGSTEMVTVFDDFNDAMTGVTLGAATGDADTNVWEDCGWVMTDDPTTAPTAEVIGMNDPADVTEAFTSSIRWFSGTGDDSGGNMQLDLINADLASGANHLTGNAGRRNFPHIWIPETGAGTEVLDDTVWVFACRVGFRADGPDPGTDVGSDWNAKLFIGWAAAGDTSIMDHDDGAITTTNGNLHGFHIPEDGSIDGISKRITAGAMVDGTNFTELHAAGAVDNTLANGVVTVGDTLWYDLALRMTITDMSDNDANGVTDFYSRRVPVVNGIIGDRPEEVPTQGGGTWQKTGTISNQTPNHTVALVPTIEFLNGPTAGLDATIYVDWWMFGTSRYSRRSA